MICRDIYFSPNEVDHQNTRIHLLLLWTLCQILEPIAAPPVRKFAHPWCSERGCVVSWSERRGCGAEGEMPRQLHLPLSIHDYGEQKQQDALKG